MNTRDKLIHAVTAYDRAQKGKMGHNPYALGHYFKAVDLVCQDIEAGADTRAAIARATNG